MRPVSGWTAPAAGMGPAESAVWRSAAGSLGLGPGLSDPGHGRSGGPPARRIQGAAHPHRRDRAARRGRPPGPLVSGLPRGLPLQPQPVGRSLPGPPCRFRGNARRPLPRRAGGAGPAHGAGGPPGLGPAPGRPFWRCAKIPPPPCCWPLTWAPPPWPATCWTA